MGDVEQEATAGGFRLSPQQKRLWQAMEPRGGVPLAWCRLELEGAVDPARLRAALASLVERHEILRTRYERVAGMGAPLQVVSEDRGFALEERGDDRACACSGGCASGAAAEALPFRVCFTPVSETRAQLTLRLSALSGDAEGMLNLARELAAAYAGEAAGDAMQYADLAEWMNDAVDGEEAEEARAHWRRQGAGFPWAGALPFGVEALEPAGWRPLRIVRPLAPGAAEAAERAAQAAGVSPRALLLAAWSLLVARLAGGETPLGVVAPGRDYDELRDVPGLFERTLPLPAIPPAPGASFADVAAGVAAALREAEEWQDGFAWADVSADEAGAFPVAFEYQDRRWSASAGGVTWRVVDVDGRGGAFAVKLCCARTAAGLVAEVHYDARLSRDAAVLLGERFEALLARLAADPAADAAAVPVIGREERERVLGAFAGTGAPTQFVPVHERFAQAAARFPDRAAVVFDGQETSYAALDAAANRLAHRLRALGAGPEARVAICLERSAEVVVAVLAALKAGAAYLPLDPSLPAARLALLLERAAPVAVVTGARLGAALPAGAPRLRLDEEGLAALPAHAPAIAVEPGQAAYVLYTSGSTGEPKGVVVPHGALAAYVDGAVERLELEEGMHFATVSTFAADLGNTVVFPSLALGGTLHVVPGDAVADPARLAALFAGRPIDVLKIVPSHLAALLASGDAAAFLPRARLVLGGEALRAELVEAARAAVPGARVFNHYGPTETTVGIAAGPVEAKPRPGAPRTATLPLGRPLGATRVYLLDAGLQPVPVGTPGELYAAGPQVARGYFGRPAATAAAFLPDPHAAQPGGRMYRTGDLARWLPDGTVEFVGRADEQVKVRGFRVEPGEAAAVLRGHAGVEDAVVVPRADAAGALQLVAYVVPPAGGVRRVLELDADPELAGVERHTLPDGRVVCHLNRNETEFLFREIFTERSYMRGGVRLPARGATVFDVGANIGFFSLFAAQASPGARVYAFEPIPEVCRVLRANHRLHGVAGRVIECGVAAAEGSATFTYYPHLSLVSGRYAEAGAERAVVRAFLGNQAAEQGSELPSGALLEELLDERLTSRTTQVALRTVSSVIREEGIERIDLLKVDVQKAEAEVLAGIEDAHWPLIAQVAVEVHDEDGRLARAVALLESHGFRVEVEQETALAHTGQFNVFAVRPEAAFGPEAEAAVESGGWSPEKLVEELREHARARLPEPLVPAAIVLLPRLPLTANGKLDRAALPAPSEGAGRHAYTAPSTATERALAALWEELLGRPRVGVDDDFFALGGHSLLATRLIARVRDGLRAEVPLMELFANPTLAAFAAAVDRRRGAAAPRERPALVALPRGGELALSFAQERLWFLAQLDPGSPAYNVPEAMRVLGPLDADALRRALAEVVSRHEALRTVFPAVDGRPRAVVLDPESFPLECDDLRWEGDEAREARVEALAAGEAWRPFDLAAGPLLRARLVRVGEEEHVLLLTLHHIVVDGWSKEVLVTELSALYAAFAAGEPSPLEPLAVQYADYAAWQRAWLAAGVLDEQLAWWKERLAGAPATQRLPTDGPGGEETGAVRSAILLPELGGRLRAVAAEGGATPFMALLAAFCVVLRHYGGDDDVVVGTNTAGRPDRRLEGLVGFFLNQVVLRSSLAGDPTFGELLGRVRQTTLDAYEHQDLPFERLVDALSGDRAGSRTPLFRVKVDFQNTAAREARAAGLTFVPVEQEAGPAHFDLLLLATDDGQELEVRLNYNTALFQDATIERMLARYLAVLEDAVLRPATRVSALLALLDEADERDRQERERELQGAALHRLKSAGRRALATPTVKG